MNGEIIYTSVVDENGQEISESTPAANDTKVREYGNVNKAALAWACLFSSKVACVGAAGVAGGAMLIGPWGAAITGSAAGSACEMLFTTLVEKYGGKDAACCAEGAMNS